MAFILCSGFCFSCGTLFSFNAELVPSIQAIWRDDHWVYDASAPRRPICLACVERINPTRKQNGLPPIVPVPGAYDPEEVA